MKPTKENIAFLKRMGFSYHPSSGELELSVGWSINIQEIKSIPWLVRRIYEGRAEQIIDCGDRYKYRGWTLIPKEL